LYQENHPESLDFKPPVRQSAPEIDFAPKTVLAFHTPTIASPASIVPLIDEIALQLDAQQEINRVTDINEMIRLGNFPAAEYLLGRKLTMDELREKMVRDLMKAPEKLEQQLRAEIGREKKKAEVLKKIEDEAKKNAPPPPQAPPLVPQAPPLVPQAPPLVPQAPPLVPQAPPQAPQTPQTPPQTPPRSVTPPQSSTQEYLDAMDAAGIDDVAAVQALMTTTKAMSAYLISHGVTPHDLPPLLLAHAMARYEQIGTPSSSSPPEDDATKAIRAFEEKWVDLNLNGTNLGYTLQEGVLAETNDFAQALKLLALDPKDEAAILNMQKKLHQEMGYSSSSSSSSSSSAPKKSKATAVYTMPPMNTEAEKFASSKAMAESFALSKNVQGGLTPIEIYKARQLYKQYISAVAADFKKRVEDVSNPSNKVKKDFQKDYSGLPMINATRANKPDLSKAMKMLDTEAADKLQEITNYAAKNGIQLGTGMPVRKMRVDWVPFGTKFLINMDKFRRGIWAIGYTTSRQPPQWARGGAELTRPLRNVIQAFLDGEPLDTSYLDDREKAWITNVWTKALIVKGKPLSFDVIKTKQLRNKQDVSDRMKLLLGEMNAGNDSPLILKELNQLRDKMRDSGWISPGDLKKLDQLLAMGF